MKRFLVALFSAALVFAACDKYDDSALQNRLNNLEGRVTTLEATVNQLNSNLASLQTLVEALQNEITVKVISKTKDGYTITFSDGVSVTISNGEDGADGEKGDTPLIGVKAEDDVYYWTVDGEWLLDSEGNRVVVTGALPKVKVEDGKWFVSYDGTNWQEIGTTEGMSGIIVTEDANFVYLTVPGSGTTLTLSKSTRFTIDIASLDYLIQSGVTTEIPYSIFGADGTEKLFVQSDGYMVSYDAQKIYVTPKEGVVYGEVLVMAVRNSDQAVCGVVLSFAQGIFEVTEAVQVAAEGGEVEALVRTNLDYEVIIPEDAQSWISVAPGTKAVREETVKLAVLPNEAENARTAKVEFKPATGVSLFLTVYQEGVGTPDVPGKIEAITVAEFLAKPESTEVWYQLTGKISGSINTKYGNFDLVDNTGSVYVYGLTATPQEENDQSYASLGLKAGDIVTLIGQRGSFNGKIEVLNAYYVSHEPGQPDQPADGKYSSSIAWDLVSSAYDQDAVVNGEAVEHVLKLGTSSKPGEAKLTIPSGVSKIGFYAVAWKGAGNVDINVGTRSVTVKANDGATGNPTYEMSVSKSDYYEVSVSKGTVTVSADKRVIIFGINAVK